MEWVKAWKKLPDKDGLYLCDIEEHYGIFHFKDGKFLPNDYMEWRGETQISRFSGDEENIVHWMHLPDFRQISLHDIKEVQDLKKQRKNMQKKAKAVN